MIDLDIRSNILFGPPGTGKTTALLDLVEKALARGVPPEKIAFFAFTRKAATEAMTRAMDRFKLSAKELPWFRTLHSAAFKLLGLKRDEVMDTQRYKELGAALGSFTFEFNYSETTERPPMGGGLGDKALSVYALARAKLSDIETVWRASEAPELSLRDVARFTAALNDYKQAAHIFDFNDFLDHPSHGPLDLELLIIDEAQDLTAQQWAFVRKVGAKAKNIIIAGDDDQCIFEWAGADLTTFLSIKGRLIVLPKSYRLPLAIWGKATALTERIRIRQKKTWEPKEREDKRSVLALDYPDQVELSEKVSWLLLTRHKYQTAAMRKICRDNGVVYQEDGQWSNQAPAVRAVVFYERLRRGESISGVQSTLVARFVSGMGAPNAHAQEVFWDDLSWPFEGKPDWMEALRSIGLDEREYIRRLRREGESLSAPGRVVISTIHGSKGGEADNVMLLPDVSKRVSKQADDQEMRVWYVGVSRARQKLFLPQPQTRRFFHV